MNTPVRRLAQGGSIRRSVRLCATATAAVGLLGVAGTADAASARTVIPVRGEVNALAFSGDDAVVANQRSPHVLTVERLRAGAPATVVLRHRSDGRDEQVSLAASPDALAVGVARGSFDHSAVWVGPPAGPLRQVAACNANGLAGPVAVFGPRVAWGDAGCHGARPTIAIGAADATVPVRRVALDGLAGSLALGAGDSSLAALITGASGEAAMYPFGAAGLGDALATAPHPLVAVGILADGTRVGLGTGSNSDCAVPRIFTVAPGGGAQRTVPIGRVAVGVCLGDQLGTMLGGTGDVPRVSGDRIAAMVLADPRRGDDGEAFDIVSARADGSDARVHAHGDDVRAADQVAIDGDRIAWAQQACAGGSQVVVDSITAPTYVVRHCRGEILTRSARVRDGAITVRVRCPEGCRGTLDGGRFVGARSFAIERGTIPLRLRVSLGQRRSARVKLRLELAYAGRVADRATVTVRR